MHITFDETNAFIEENISSENEEMEGEMENLKINDSLTRRIEEPPQQEEPTPQIEENASELPRKCRYSSSHPR